MYGTMTEQRLLLASDQLPGLAGVVDKPLAECRALYIPTAATLVPDRSYVALDLRRLEAAKLALTVFDIEGRTPSEVGEALGGVDVVVVTGGNVYSLLHHARQSGFASALGERVPTGTLAYVGISAGAMIVAPQIPVAISPASAAAVPDLVNTEGLGLVDILILPHHNVPDRRARNEQIMREHAGVQRFMPLTDWQALLIRGGEMRLAEENLE